MSLEQVVALLDRALQGELTPDELDRLWPEAPADPYLVEVREDLRFALEHVPGSRADPARPDLARWRKMPEHGDLRLHLVRVRQRAAGE